MMHKAMEPSLGKITYWHRPFHYLQTAALLVATAYFSGTNSDHHLGFFKMVTIEYLISINK